MRIHVSWREQTRENYLPCFCVWFLFLACLAISQFLYVYFAVVSSQTTGIEISAVGWHACYQVQYIIVGVALT